MTYSEISNELLNIEKEIDKLNKKSSKLRSMQSEELNKCLLKNIYSIAENVSREIGGTVESICCSTKDESQFTYFTLKVDDVNVFVYPNRYGKCAVDVYKDNKTASIKHSKLIAIVARKTSYCVDLALNQIKSVEEGE